MKRLVFLDCEHGCVFYFDAFRVLVVWIALVFASGMLRRPASGQGLGLGGNYGETSTSVLAGVCCEDFFASNIDFLNMLKLHIVLTLSYVVGVFWFNCDSTRYRLQLRGGCRGYATGQLPKLGQVQPEQYCREQNIVTIRFIS